MTVAEVVEQLFEIPPESRVVILTKDNGAHRIVSIDYCPHNLEVTLEID